MVRIPSKAVERLTKQTPKFQKVLQDASKRDINEADTVSIIMDIISDVLGYDKYKHITQEQAIRGTYCDIAIKVDEKIQFLIEVKAIGISLNENHLRQALGYGAQEGIQWIILTNGIEWHIYKVRFEQPISLENIINFNFLELNTRKSEDQEKLFMICYEGLSKNVIGLYHKHISIVNRFMVGGLILSDPVLDTIRRELKKLSSTKIDNTEIRNVLIGEVIKRDILDSEDVQEAKKLIKKHVIKKTKKNRQQKISKKERIQENVTMNPFYSSIKKE